MRSSISWQVNKRETNFHVYCSHVFICNFQLYKFFQLGGNNSLTLTQVIMLYWDCMHSQILFNLKSEKCLILVAKKIKFVFVKLCFRSPSKSIVMKSSNEVYLFHLRKVNTCITLTCCWKFWFVTTCLEKSTLLC